MTTAGDDERSDDPGGRSSPKLPAVLQMCYCVLLGGWAGCGEDNGMGDAIVNSCSAASSAASERVLQRARTSSSAYVCVEWRFVVCV